MTEKKEVIPGMRPIDVVLEYLGLALLLLSILNIFWQYDALPDRVAIHFDSTGTADGWSGKASLFVVPVIFAFSFVLIGLVSRFVSPENYNHPGKYAPGKEQRMYALSRTMIHGMQASIGFVSLYAANHLVEHNTTTDPVSNIFNLWVILGAILLPILIYLYFFLKERKA